MDAQQSPLRWYVRLVACTTSLLLLTGIYACAETPTPTATPSLVTQVSQLLTSGGDFVKSDRKNGIITYSGNAKFVWQDLSAFSDTLQLYQNPQTRAIEKAVASGNVRIVTQDTTVTGDQGTYYVDEQKMEIEGHAKAIRDNNMITAQRLIVWSAQKMLEGYGDATTERVVMTVYSQAVAPTDATATPTPNAAEPMTRILVEADTLKYDNEKRLATFTGNVNARKDTATIQAEEMLVYLAAADATTDNTIEKIEVNGKVLITQESMTVTGQKGVYNNREQVVTITGNAEQQAQAEDKKQQTVMRADTIRLVMKTNDVEGEGNVVVTAVLPEKK
jgi:lipopolysaccharide transport protein LptA